jgi:hypothetical protein
LEGQAAESQSRAQKYAVETQLLPEELTLKYAEDMDEKEFQKKKQMSELLLKEQELQIKQDASANDAMAKAEEARMREQLMQGAGNGPTNNASPPAQPPAAGI